MTRIHSPTIALLLAVFMMAISTVASGSPLPDSISKPGYSNRIILVRHAEKGFTPDAANPNGVSPRPKRPEPSWWSRFVPWGGPPPPPWGGDRPHGPPGGGDRPRGPPWRGGPGGPGGPKGKFPEGLSDKGRERAQYIRTLFGNESDYDFGLIFAAPRNASVKETERTYATVAPLAKDLGLEVNIDCANSEASCVVSQVEEFVKTSDADILICWKHRDLNTIATALGAPNAKRIYPDERNDVIWIMQNGAIVEKRSMHCPGLDDDRVDRDDPDLEVEEPSLSWAEWIASWGGWLNIWRAQRQVVTTSSL